MPQDFITDLVCEPVPFAAFGLNGYCHKGMLLSAQSVVASIAPILFNLRNRSSCTVTYRLVLTGHSL